MGPIDDYGFLNKIFDNEKLFLKMDIEVIDKKKVKEKFFKFIKILENNESYRLEFGMYFYDFESWILENYSFLSRRVFRVGDELRFPKIDT